MDEICVKSVRPRARDAVHRASPGPPEAPMARMPVACCLWQRFLRFDVDHPIEPNRRRLALSAGHASMLLEAVLRLTGVRTRPTPSKNGDCRASAGELLRPVAERTPSWELLERYRGDHVDYREHVLPDSVSAPGSVEHGATLGWTWDAGRHGPSIGLANLGASEPPKELQRKFGFAPESIIGAGGAQLAAARR